MFGAMRFHFEGKCGKGVVILGGLWLMSAIGWAVPRNEAEELRMTLREAVHRALVHNLGLEAERLTPRIAEEDVRMADAFFDPELEVSAAQIVRQRSLAASELEGAVRPRSETFISRAILRKRIQTGATISLENRLARSETNSQLATLNPAYDAEVSVNIWQPLLRGAGRTVATADRERARLGRELADLELDAVVMDVVEAVEFAYFNLAFALEQLAVRRFSLELAETLLAEAHVRRETGLGSSLDVLRAEVALADRREAMVEAEQQVQDRRDDLLDLIGQFRRSEEMDVVVVPEPLEEVEPMVPAVDDVLLLMGRQRPEFLFAVEQIELFELDLRVARNLRRPDVGVGAGVGYTGLDRSPRSAYRDLADGDGYFWRVEAALVMPIGLGEDRARYRRAELRLDREALRLTRFRQELLVEARSSVRALETGGRRLELARDFTGASERQFQMEQERFRAGAGTSREVLDAQEDLEESRLRELRARTELHQAKSRLRRVTGESLEPYDLRLEE
jgi:outer membrane protein